MADLPAAAPIPQGFEAIVERAERRRAGLLAAAEMARARLPLKFLRQEAHFTTPASDIAMLEKAVVGGLAATSKILARMKIGTDELASTLGVEKAELESVLAGDPRAPLVMVDGEDAQALREDVVARGRENAVKAFTTFDWGRVLRFYRPSGLRLDFCVNDIVTVLSGAAAARRSPEDPFPIDGIIWPKVEHPAEIEFVCDTLDDLEKALGLPHESVKLEFLVESGFSLMNLPDIVRASIGRLAGIIFGIADYSADIALPEIRNDHPVCDFARAMVVNMAGAIGVPAIDSMTVNYPVADRSLSEEENRARILSRLKECYDDARHGLALGMTGKWVGHPAQLAMVLLAYRHAIREEEIQDACHTIAAYRQAVSNELGATIIKGVMSDRATDRHVRALLRRAVALGRLAPERGLDYGLISREEYDELRRTA